MQISKFVITVTKEQMRVLIDALDLYSRIGAGQLRDIMRYAPIPFMISEHKEEAYNIIDRLESVFTGLPPHAHFGIFSDEVPENAKIAFDVQQVIRHTLAWSLNPKGGITVDFDIPMKCSRTVLATCEVKE